MILCFICILGSALKSRMEKLYTYIKKYLKGSMCNLEETFIHLVSCISPLRVINTSLASNYLHFQKFKMQGIIASNILSTQISVAQTVLYDPDRYGWWSHLSYKSSMLQPLVCVIKNYALSFLKQVCGSAKCRQACLRQDESLCIQLGWLAVWPAP